MNDIKTFNLREYASKNKDTKLKYFFEFLLQELNLNDVDHLDNHSLENISDDFLIRALHDYLFKQKVTAKITANNFISSIIKFFNILSDQYNITNPIFKSIDRMANFRSKAKAIIFGLKDSAEGEIANENDYHNLCMKVADFCGNIDLFLPKVLSQLKIAVSVFINGDEKQRRAGEYSLLFSCVAVKIALLYGLKNDVIANIKISDIDIQSKTLLRGKYYLVIDCELLVLLKALLCCRNQILEQLGQTSNYLFINYRGLPIFSERGTCDNAQLFKFSPDAPGKHSKRRRLEMIRTGMDLCTLSEITGIDIKSCEPLQRIYNEAADVGSAYFEMHRDIASFSFETAEDLLSIPMSGMMICPNCHQPVTNSSEDWVLILREDGGKYLACQHCKGGF